MSVDPKEWTPQQLEDAIPPAIKARDFEAVHALLLLMAVKDPHRAVRVRQELRDALAVADALDGAS